MSAGYIRRDLLGTAGSGGRIPAFRAVRAAGAQPLTVAAAVLPRSA
ncbi:hypothetical protein ABT126_03640 [Streptomyces sp. NPDC002012]